VAETYDYKDTAGTLLYQVVRFDPKGFRQRKPDGSGGWTWDPDDLSPVLYRLPEVIAASTVMVLEGEKDVETAYRLGLPAGWAATTCPFGTRWMSAYGEVLRDKNVVLCPDSDAPGQEHLRRIGRDLVGKVADMRLIVLPDKIKDLSEWATGKTKEQLTALLDSARPVDFPP
jgi:DNA primase